MSILKTYRTVSVLSIDVALGAVCGAIFFSKLFDQPVGPLTLVALALTVWLVYTADHLKDAISEKKAGSTWRRIFHYRHRRILLLCMLSGMLINAVIALQLPDSVLKAGLLLGIPVAAYVLLQHRVCWLKEILVALLYTGGLLVPAAEGFEFDAHNVMLVVAFMGIAFTNLIIFSRYDYAADVAERRNSFVTFWGMNTSANVIKVLFAVVSVLLICCGLSVSTVILLLMTVLHLALFSFETYFRAHNRFRFAGDAIFFLPLFILLFDK